MRILYEGTPMITLRHAEPGDYAPLIAVIDEWWGGRAVAAMLPKLFFVHFRDTSFIAEADALRVGFLIGFRSQTFADEAYIHFVGVHPNWRREGVGRLMYAAFFVAAREAGCKRVRCVTSPVNRTSIGFHLRMGFEPDGGDAVADGVPYHTDYDGRGESRVVFVKHLGE
jgi:ribosomal protein S18 acetylase RimI-like enzyme